MSDRIRNIKRMALDFLMAKAGCATVIMVVESDSQRMLYFLRKGNVKEIEKTFRCFVKQKIILSLEGSL
jgi:hypothetical protein